jgi:hypothetical protein
MTEDPRVEAAMYALSRAIYVKPSEVSFAVMKVLAAADAVEIADQFEKHIAAQEGRR